jgi:hypothetical protein
VDGEARLNASRSAVGEGEAANDTGEWAKLILGGG